MSIGLSGGNISLPQLPGLIPVGSPNLVPNGDFSQYHNTGTVYSDVLTESVNYGWTLNASGSFTFGSTGAVSTVNGATMYNGNPNWKPLTASSGGNSLPLTAQATFTEPSTLPSSNAGSVALYENATNYYQAYSNGSTFYLVKNVAGTVTSLASVAQALTASSTYTVTLGIDISGHLTAKLYSGSGTGGTLLQTLTITDTSLGGGFLMQLGGDTGVIITDVVVTAALPDELQLNVVNGTMPAVAIVGVQKTASAVAQALSVVNNGIAYVYFQTANFVNTNLAGLTFSLAADYQIITGSSSGAGIFQNNSGDAGYINAISDGNWHRGFIQHTYTSTNNFIQIGMGSNSSTGSFVVTNLTLTESTTAQAFFPPFPVLDRPIDASGLASGLPAIELGSGYGLFQGGNANFKVVSTSGALLSSPAIPASGTPLTNPYSYNCVVYIDAATAATVTVAINGNTVGTTLAGGNFTVILSNGATITLTYTTAPTWVWFGQ